MEICRQVFVYDCSRASDESALVCDDPSLAHQSFKEECDINTIIDRFGIGQVPEMEFPAFQNADFTEVVDYQTALNQVIAADAAFMQLPAKVRSRFGNDPAAFVDFCSDPANGRELVDMGLALKNPNFKDDFQEPANPAAQS